jgi:beta-xylosidase
LQRNKILEVDHAAMAFPFFNGVEANKINPALNDLKFDTVLDEFKADRMCTQIVRDFQSNGYTHIYDYDFSDEPVPIQKYIDQVEAVTQSNIEDYNRRQK